MTEPINPKDATTAQATPASAAEVLDDIVTSPAEKQEGAADNYAPAAAPLVVIDQKRGLSKLWVDFGKMTKQIKPRNYPAETLLAVQALGTGFIGVATALGTTPLGIAIIDVLGLEMAIMGAGAAMFPKTKGVSGFLNALDHMARFKEEFITRFSKVTGASSKEAKQVAQLYYRNRTETGFKTLVTKVAEYLTTNTLASHDHALHDHIRATVDLFDLLGREANEQFYSGGLPPNYLHALFQAADPARQMILADLIADHPTLYFDGTIFDALINKTDDLQLIRSLNLGRMKALQYCLEHSLEVNLFSLAVKTIHFVLQQENSQELLFELFDSLAKKEVQIRLFTSFLPIQEILKDITNPQYALLILDVLKEKISGHYLNAELFIYLCNHYESAWQKAIEDNEQIAARTPEEWAMLRVIEKNSERAFSPPVDILEDTRGVTKEHLQQLDDLRLAVYKKTLEETQWQEWMNKIIYNALQSTADTNLKKQFLLSLLLKGKLEDYIISGLFPVNADGEASQRSLNKNILDEHLRDLTEAEIFNVAKTLKEHLGNSAYSIKATNIFDYFFKKLSADQQNLLGRAVSYPVSGQEKGPYDLAHLPSTEAKLKEMWRLLFERNKHPSPLASESNPYFLNFAYLNILNHQMTQLTPEEKRDFYDSFLKKLATKGIIDRFWPVSCNAASVALYLVDKKINPEKNVELLMAALKREHAYGLAESLWHKLIAEWPQTSHNNKMRLFPRILTALVTTSFYYVLPDFTEDFSPFEADIAQLPEKIAEKYLKKYRSHLAKLKTGRLDLCPETFIQNYSANLVMLTRQLSRPKQLDLFNQILNDAKKQTEENKLFSHLSVLGALALELDLPKPQLKEWFSFLTQNIKHPSNQVSQWTKNYLQENEDYFANHEDLAAIIQDLLGGLHVTLDPQVMQRTLAHVVEQVRYLQNDTGDEVVLGMGRALVRTGGDEALLPVLHTGMTKATTTGIRFMLDELRIAISLNDNSRLKQAYVQLLGEVTRYLEPEKHLGHLEEIIIHLISPLTKVRAKAASALQQALTFVSNLDLQFAKQMLIGHLEGNLWTAQLGSILGLEVVIKEHQTRNLDLSELAAYLLGIYQKMTGPPKVKKALFQLFVNVAPPQTADNKPLELGAGEILIESQDEVILPAHDEITAVDLTDAAAINSDGSEEGTDGAQADLPIATSLLTTEGLPGINGMFVRK